MTGAPEQPNQATMALCNLTEELGGTARMKR
jgi:hypothetical protein